MKSKINKGRRNTKKQKTKGRVKSKQKRGDCGGALSEIQKF
jgi:hypothetical protein